MVRLKCAHVATFRRVLTRLGRIFPRKSIVGNRRRFCDDPVWKLSIRGRGSMRPCFTLGSLIFVAIRHRDARIP